MTQNDCPIGVYDSGIGGLTVLKSLRRAFPHEKFVYFADTLHLPYGTKTPQQIAAYSYNIASWFVQRHQVKLIVAACHTSSAVALMSSGSPFFGGISTPVVGTILPLLKMVLTHYADRHIGLIATPVSVMSQTHETLFRASGFQGKFQAIACPDFVPLIEENMKDPLLVRRSAERYLKDFEAEGLDALIYGCTHYPFIRSIVESVLPPTTIHIDPAEAICEEVEQLLKDKEMLRSFDSSTDQEDQLKFFCSFDHEKFSQKIQQLMKIDRPLVEEINIHPTVLRVVGE